MSAGLNFHRHMNVSRARGLLMAMDTANFYAQEAIEYTEEKKIINLSFCGKCKGERYLMQKQTLF